MPNIDLDELQKLTAYLEECNRKGAVAELTAEWAMLLAHVLDIARDALAERSASIELLE
jgi:hypothetical protein